MIGKFSVTILMQAFNQSDNSKRSSFEHKVVLYEFNEDVSSDYLKTVIVKDNTEEAYLVEGGIEVYWKPVKIIDVFELDSSITFDNNSEVYSRFIIEDNLEAADVINKYFSDYVWEDTELTA